MCTLSDLTGRKKKEKSQMLKFQDVPALKPNLAVILDLYVVQF